MTGQNEYLALSSIVERPLYFFFYQEVCVFFALSSQENEVEEEEEEEGQRPLRDLIRVQGAWN